MCRCVWLLWPLCTKENENCLQKSLLELLYCSLAKRWLSFLFHALNSKVTVNRLAMVNTSEINASGYSNWQRFSVKYIYICSEKEPGRLGVTLYFHCNSLPACPCQPAQATELELEVVPSHAEENVVCCILLSSRLAYPVVLGSFSTGQDLQDPFVCPSASTQQVRSPAAFSGTGGICRSMIYGFGCDVQFTSKKIKGGGCFVFLRHNKPAGHPCPCFYIVFAECSYFFNSSGISWHLPVESLERRTDCKHM